MIRDYVFTIQETADVLSVNRETVSRWLKAGRLSGESIGGAVLIPRWAVEMLRDQRQAQRRGRRQGKGETGKEIQSCNTLG